MTPLAQGVEPAENLLDPNTLAKILDARLVSRRLRHFACQTFARISSQAD
jgi:hypothetical protein